MTFKSSSPSGLFQRFVRRGIMLSGTGLAIALALGLVSFGADIIAARAADTNQVEPRPATPVVVAPLDIQKQYDVTARFTGPIEPARSTDLAFEPGGSLAQILVDEGDVVQGGQVLARLDTRSLEADRAAQEAAIEASTARRDLAQLTADRQSELASREFTSSQRRDEAKFNLAVAEAEIAQSKAALSAIEVALAKSEILAPYSGVIRSRVVDEGARLAPNQTLLTLQSAQVQTRVGLPEDLAGEIAVGDMVEVKLPTGQVTGIVERLRPDLDPATRTRGVLISLPEDLSPVTGTLAEITLSRTVPVAGAWVPISALSEGVDGLWTVFVVPGGSETLERIAVTLEHIAQDQAYVAGAFPVGAQVVIGGTHRLSAGQTTTLVAGG
ncbi:MAG: efflux RND transporter periplasmic adaptor subunit [Dinoroseobacter sp.]|nr:efflux RND transporter periplasmic adaptor subunit [Dinoroseobacter sp.]